MERQRERARRQALPRGRGSARLGFPRVAGPPWPRCDAGPHPLPLTGEAVLALQTLLAPAWLGTPIWIWCTFFVLVLALLALDLGLLHRGERAIGMRERPLLYAGDSCSGRLACAWTAYALGAQA